MAKAKIKKVANAEIRAAKTFLNKKGLSTEEISPKKFATAAKKLDKGFQETFTNISKRIVRWSSLMADLRNKTQNLLQSAFSIWVCLMKDH